MPCGRSSRASAESPRASTGRRAPGRTRSGRRVPVVPMGSLPKVAPVGSKRRPALRREPHGAKSRAETGRSVSRGRGVRQNEPLPVRLSRRAGTPTTAGPRSREASAQRGAWQGKRRRAFGARPGRVLAAIRAAPRTARPPRMGHGCVDAGSVLANGWRAARERLGRRLPRSRENRSNQIQKRERCSGPTVIASRSRRVVGSLIAREWWSNLRWPRWHAGRASSSGRGLARSRLTNRTAAFFPPRSIGC